MPSVFHISQSFTRFFYHCGGYKCCDPYIAAEKKYNIEAFRYTIEVEGEEIGIIEKMHKLFLPPLPEDMLIVTCKTRIKRNALSNIYCCYYEEQCTNDNNNNNNNNRMSNIARD